MNFKFFFIILITLLFSGINTSFSKDASHAKSQPKLEKSEIKTPPPLVSAKFFLITKSFIASNYCSSKPAIFNFSIFIKVEYSRKC